MLGSKTFSDLLEVRRQAVTGRILRSCGADPSGSTRSELLRSLAASVHSVLYGCWAHRCEIQLASEWTAWAAAGLTAVLARSSAPAPSSDWARLVDAAEREYAALAVGAALPETALDNWRAFVEQFFDIARAVGDGAHDAAPRPNSEVFREWA
ncbi:MAG: hypothetical protein GF320_06500 [Armatimonadia bacterium]|nr:hypothetical protein [Armatimonadia bacterium]